MSIQQTLSDRANEGQLVELLPLLPAPVVRAVWLTEEVLEQLDPGTANDDFALEAGRLRRRLEGVVKGHRLVVGNRQSKACDMKRLEPSSDEVWEIRERPNPGIRVFCRFVEFDCLAGTNVQLVRTLFARWWIRADGDFWPGWNAEIKRCKAIWRNLFVSYPPHSGVSINDYLSNATGPSSF